MNSGSGQPGEPFDVNPGAQWQLAFQLLFEPNPSHMALVGLDGTVLAVNAAWRQYAGANGVAAGYEFVGQNYLAVCEAGVAAGEWSAEAAYLGLLGVLRSGRPKFTCEYACVSGDGAGGRREQWFRMWVEPQTPSVPAVIVAHQLLFDRPTREPPGTLGPVPDGWAAGPPPGGWDTRGA